MINSLFGHREQAGESSAGAGHHSTTEFSFMNTRAPVTPPAIVDTPAAPTALPQTPPQIIELTEGKEVNTTPSNQPSSSLGSVSNAAAYVHHCTSLPDKDEVYNPKVQDVLLFDDYPKLPHLRSVLGCRFCDVRLTVDHIIPEKEY
jgi:hypothetical protein